jgi:hypothetical protein
MGHKSVCSKCSKRKKCYKKTSCSKINEKVNIKVRCRPAHDGKCNEDDAGEWNLAIFPEESRSTFRPTPNEATSGQFSTFANSTDNHADFTAVGLGNATQADLLNTRYTLETPSAPNTTTGFSIYFVVVPSSSGNYIKFIQNDIIYEDRWTARVCNTNIVEAGSTASPSSAEFEGWTFITHENE